MGLLGGADFLVDEPVMLTADEQKQVMEMVVRIVRNDRIRRTRVQQLTMSDKSARECYERDLENLADLLKELG